MSIRLIAIDIDGTLLPSSGEPISRRNRNALRAAELQGIEIVIATGRRQAFAVPRIQPLGLRRNGIVISSNGAVIRRSGGELLERRFLEIETARALCAEIRGYGTLVFTFDRIGVGALVIEDLHCFDQRLARWVEANQSDLAGVAPLERAFDSGEAPIQGMLCGGVRQMKEVEDRLLRGGLGGRLSMHRTEYAARDMSILDLLPQGCSKGTALESVARRRGFIRQEVMAIGDNLNDREMLDYAGRGVLMANAGDEMLAVAGARGWERTGSCDDDGVAQVIEELLGGLPDAPASPEGRTERGSEGLGREDKITEWA